MNKIKNLFGAFYIDLILLFKSPRALLYRLKCIFENRILGIKRNLSIKYLGHKITFPNSHNVQWVLMETFVWELLDGMKGLSRVLDIGGFIGESAIYLATYNKEVYVYELSQTNFKYLKNNCKQIKNIHYFNGCISKLDNEYIQFCDTGFVSSTNQKQQRNGLSITVKNYNIISLLRQRNFDGIKIDIEGGEYDIIKPIIDNKLFNFKKGIIEFHELKNSQNIAYFYIHRI